MNDLDQLARWRTIGARHSEEVVEMGQRVLRGKTGDQEWAIREQLAIAALDLGQIKLATSQIQLLQRRFAASPRVRILDGLRLEVTGDLDGAKKVYEGLLAADETNISAHQRLITLTASTSPSTAIPALLKYLDTFYSDPSGWSLLADLYADQGMYHQSLAALAHVMVLQAWDEGAVRRAGEVAYTLGDYQLALKHFLRAAEMEGGATSNPDKSRTRSWWGIKLAVARLLDSPGADTTVPEEMRTTPKQLQRLDALATERILDAGAKGKNLEVLRKVLGEAKMVR
ncbi:hypothetical protein IAU60_005593 [Kwoniella sp. DSM 27419]